MNKIQMMIAGCMLATLSMVAQAASVGPAARTVIPSAVEQIISIDYRTVKQSNTALALKAQVLPDHLKEFEKALEGVGIIPDRDLESLTFASFRNGKHELLIMGVASGSFSPATVLKKFSKTIKPVKYHESDIYPMSKELSMTFLDNNNLLLGDAGAIQIALSTRNGDVQNFGSNQKLGEVIETVKNATVWSVLDHQGTREMLLSAVGPGDAIKLASYTNLENQILDSHYTMNFDNGVSFDLDILTSDSATSAELASFLQAGILFKNATANPAAKIAFQNMKVSFDRSDLQIRFKADREPVQKLLQARFFAIASPTPGVRADRRQ